MNDDGSAAIDAADPPAPISRLRVLARTGSTNTDLADLATADPTGWPHLSVVWAHTQTAGKGRIGRVWQSASLRALTFSVLVRPRAQAPMWGWVPLLAGLATVRALRAMPRCERSAPSGEGGETRPGDPGSPGDPHAPERIAIKWPNDVVDLFGGGDAQPGWGRMRKLGGILSEVLPAGDGVVVGIGLNLSGAPLPVPWAGTVQDAGVDLTGTGSAQSLLGAIVAEFDAQLRALDRGEPARQQVQQVCASIGSPVQVDLPDGTVVTGTATALAQDGGLVVSTATGARTVHAGDVRHLRFEHRGA